MTLKKLFEDHVKEKGLFSSKDKLLLAVSGGVDSVVLCELCKQSGFDFTIAHCNFRLRGEESERDERFVKELGKKYDTTVLVKAFDTERYASEKKISIQEAARELRYGWFAGLVNRQLTIDNSQSAKDKSITQGAPTHHSPFTIHLLTAHHKDDNIETLLMNFFRGTGLHGLTGIPESTGYIRRPLLPFSKEEILEFAKENQLSFVEDSSNESSKYTRNFFRNELLPAISKVYPQVKQNLSANIERFKEVDALYSFAVGEVKKKLCRKKGNEVHIPVKQLMLFDNRALIYDIISGYGFDDKQIDEVVKLAVSDTGKYITSPGNNYRIIKHRHWFIISPVESIQAENIIIEESTDNVQWVMGNLQFKTTPTTNHKPQTTNLIASLDKKVIQFPLLLRKWKTGDYFYPLGMKKKKKLSRFFIDQKLSKTEKEKVWVIESGKRIAWVVGHRIDERFKITEKTKEVLQVSLDA